MTVLFSGSVFANEANIKSSTPEDKALMAFSRNSLYVNKITVYPAYVYNGEKDAYFDSNIYTSQSQSYTSMVAMVITAATCQNLENRFNDEYGLMQNGWRVKIDYTIDSSSPIKIEGTGGNTRFNEPAYSGKGSYEYNVLGVDRSLDLVGVLSFAQNGIGTSMFNAIIKWR